jgi:hypothetical protein
MSLISTKQVVVPDPNFGARLEDALFLGDRNISNIFDSTVTKGKELGTGIYNTVTSTDFLVNAGIGLIAGAFAAKVARPSLSFPALAATAQVALSVGNLLRAGAVRDSDVRNAENGLNLSNAISAPTRLNIQGDNKEISNYIDDAVAFRTKTNLIRLPDDVSSKYNMKIQLFKYDSSIRSGSVVGSPTDIIVLPLPQNLVDVVSIQYNNTGLGPLLGEGSKAVEEIINTLQQAGFTDALSQAYKGAMGAIRGGAASEALRVLGRRALGGISRETASALDLALGNTPNPHQVVTFNGVNLRTFQFNWRFSPNNIKESQILNNLIFTMKKRTLPTRSPNNLLLDYPSIAKMVIKPDTINNLFNFRNFFIDNFTVNYAPSGSLSFHKDQMPSEVEISMVMREFDIQTSNDYEYTSVNDFNVNTTPVEDSSVYTTTDIRNMGSS